MKTEQSIIDERKRSARKKAEIDAEVNNNKELVYNYVASRKDVIGKTCVEELKLFEKGKRYLEWLSLHGHLSRMLRTVTAGKRMYVYNAITPYVKPVIVEAVQAPPPAPNQNGTDEIVYGVPRVIRLMDREHAPVHKTERPKRRVQVSIGSSMTMFGSW